MDVKVKKSTINQKGVFALRQFQKGETVLKWHPKILNRTEFKNLKESQKHYLYKFGQKYFLMQAPEKYVNHSCEPNTEVKNTSDIAIRNINKGEEITSDYGKSAFVPFKCHCGSQKCRGWIGR